MVSNDIRKRIVESYVNGHNKKEIFCIFGVNLSTIYSIIKVYITKKIYITKVKIKGGIRKKSLSELHITKLESWIAEDASITLKSIKRMLTEEVGINVCTRTIHNYLGKFAYTLKKLPLYPQNATAWR